MPSAQPGIFAVGASTHLILEFDRLPQVPARALVGAVADLRAQGTAAAAANQVVAFGPELWREVAPSGIAPDVHGFRADVVGPDGYRMPATQHDLLVWWSGSSFDVLFDDARVALAGLRALAAPAAETSGWTYRRNRDLTGFEDGTKNPPPGEAPGVALVPPGRPGAGGSVLLVQKWKHRATSWDALSTARQEEVIGRTKPESVELDPNPATSHVRKTDQDVFGNIYRRNFPYGQVTDHGTMFVGFCSEPGPLARMLDSMAGIPGGVRDALTDFAEVLTGGYYFVPSVEAIDGFRSAANGPSP